MFFRTTTLLATAALAAAATTNTNLQTTFPTASTTTNLAAAQTVTKSASFDGEMLQWDRSPSTCHDQAEGGDQDALFILEDGATLSNVILGPNNGEGIHCKGSCTLNNIWWTDVCEDAATFLQASGTSYVNGGGARNASDKVLQHNGGGAMAVKNFFASNVGKVYRSCGNCKTQHARSSSFVNVRVEKASVVAGVNANLGDSTVISDSCVLGSAVCWLYNGNSDGKEPTKVGSGPSGTACAVSGVSTAGC
ncbi:pectate lyase [Lasiosphaeris hirsuta]|uniref:Pectate lyase n=1 Tax=Lasiosphaeris hirsuta TaxID=260670 RepID=A0AA40AZT4_9PEZI|nr:pectate lyase [Lasiosphaeris hirsuta]